MGRWQGVFLDFYGTLAGGDRQAVVDVCQAVIDAHGLELSAGDLAMQWGHYYFAAIENAHGPFQTLTRIESDTLVETLRALSGLTIDPTRFIDGLNAYLAKPRLFDEVRAVLAALPVPACIVSNADERELRAAIGHHGLRFAQVVSSELAGCYKPHAGIFRKAMELTGWSPERVLHVGDSLHSDVGGARRVGIRTAWVNRAERITDIGTDTPDHTWTDLKPLIALLKSEFL